jgi:hypothetical protein
MKSLASVNDVLLLCIFVSTADEASAIASAIQGEAPEYLTLEGALAKQ